MQRLGQDGCRRQPQQDRAIPFGLLPTCPCCTFPALVPLQFRPHMMSSTHLCRHAFNQWTRCCWRTHTTRAPYTSSVLLYSLRFIFTCSFPPPLTCPAPDDRLHRGRGGPRGASWRTTAIPTISPTAQTTQPKASKTQPSTPQAPATPTKDQPLPYHNQPAPLAPPSTALPAPPSHHAWHPVRAPVPTKTSLPHAAPASHSRHPVCTLVPTVSTPSVPTAPKPRAALPSASVPSPTQPPTALPLAPCSVPTTPRGRLLGSLPCRKGEQHGLLCSTHTN